MYLSYFLAASNPFAQKTALSLAALTIIYKSQRRSFFLALGINFIAPLWTLAETIKITVTPLRIGCKDIHIFVHLSHVVSRACVFLFGSPPTNHTRRWLQYPMNSPIEERRQRFGCGFAGLFPTKVDYLQLPWSKQNRRDVKFHRSNLRRNRNIPNCHPPYKTVDFMISIGITWEGNHTI